MYFLHLNENKICDLIFTEFKTPKVSKYRCSVVRKIKKKEPGKGLNIFIADPILVSYVTRIFHKLFILLKQKKMKKLVLVANLT